MRILLAEDEKELSRALTAIFIHEHYSVDAVYNGEDALCYMETENYDVVILDVMMPKMDGMTVLRKIREKGNKVPVLILTAKSEIDDRVEGLDSGADDYLTKPFSARELLARIRSITRRRTEEYGQKFSLGNVTLDRASFVLEAPGGMHHLTNKEYQIMEMLMRSPGCVISTERFMGKIWGYDSEAEINVVWVYLSNLRKKLASVNANIQIKAVRNQGYFLEETV